MSDPAIKSEPHIIRPDKDTFLAEENPFEAMMERFDHAAQLLKLDPGLYKVLRNPEKQIITSVPVVRDNGEVEVYTSTARSRCTPATGCCTTRRAGPPRGGSAST